MTENTTTMGFSMAQARGSIPIIGMLVCLQLTPFFLSLYSLSTWEEGGSSPSMTKPAPLMNLLVSLLTFDNRILYHFVTRKCLLTSVSSSVVVLFFL